MGVVSQGTPPGSPVDRDIFVPYTPDGRPCVPYTPDARPPRSRSPSRLEQRVTKLEARVEQLANAIELAECSRLSLSPPPQAEATHLQLAECSRLSLSIVEDQPGSCDRGDFHQEPRRPWGLPSEDFGKMEKNSSDVGNLKDFEDSDASSKVGDFPASAATSPHDAYHRQAHLIKKSELKEEHK